MYVPFAGAGNWRGYVRNTPHRKQENETVRMDVPRIPDARLK